MQNYRNSGYERKARDFYPTPSVYVDWLVPHIDVTPDMMICEPCCGENHMVDALTAHGLQVVGTDIAQGCDFLEEVDVSWADWIITNPPYGRKIGPAIVRHAIALCDNVAMLLPYDWDAAGKDRADIFGKEPPHHMTIRINKRVKWIEDSNGSGMHNYAWFIWRRNAIGCEPLTRYEPYAN